jgi:hypothetical protein
LACSEGKLVHLGIANAPNKSTLSYAKEHRPAALFEDLFYTSLNRFREQQGMGARKAKFRFKNKLLSLDSTTISLVSFKALKQNLKVKTFVGTSRNALLIQIWTALIAMLLLKWLHHLSQAKWSFSNLASMLRLNLFTYRDLRRWLENPFGTPPLVPLAEQLSLDLS